MINHELHATWRARLREQQASGLSIAGWCREQSIPAHQFHYWKKRFVSGDDTGTVAPSTAEWTAVIVAEDAPDSSESSRDHGITIQVAGTCIAVRPGFDKALLVDIVKVLQAC